MHALKRYFATFCLVLTALTLSGCIATRSGQLSISPETAVKAVYYVEQSPKDGRNLSATIASRMEARGLKASAGPAGSTDATYVVTYVDHWAWDMRMYLLDMRIELRGAKDRSIVGFGDSRQSSLAAMGKSYADVIDTALDELFKKK